MKALRILFIFTMCAFSAALVADAQATNTWVSGVGDDTNPCSRIAPCKTWAGAFSKTATGGEIDALDPGAFGAITITRSVTLDGGGGQVASVLVSGTDGIDVNAPFSVVNLRNLRIQGLYGNGGLSGTNGINFTAGSALHIEKCAIYGFLENGIKVNLASGGQVFIDDTTSQDNGMTGLTVAGTTGGVTGEVHVSISNSHFSNNGVGVVAGDSSVVTIRTSDATGNLIVGFQSYANTFGSTMSIADSVAANNGTVGVAAGGGSGTAKIRVSNISVFSNGVGFQAGTGGTIQSFGNNANTGTGAPTSRVALQ
jgi:hypothetical protein